jgi:hypothetical protein
VAFAGFDNLQIIQNRALTAKILQTKKLRGNGKSQRIAGFLG